MKQIAQRQRRSEKLTPEEFKAFKKEVAAFDTKIDAAAAFGFSVVTLDAILLKGTGHPNSIKLIRQFFTQKLAA